MQGTVLPGTYTLTYKICDNLSPQSCDTATATVIILGLNANNDTYTITQGTTTVLSPSTLANDKYMGNAATDANTNMSLLTTVSGISLNTTTGVITVGSIVAAGTYTLTYQLCDAVTTTNPCDTATITIKVMNSVDAVDDEFGIPYSATATSVGNIRTNDKYDGVTPTAANITVTFTTPLPAGLTYNASTGALTSTGLAMGNYLITYQMCDTMFPTNCDSATIALSIGYPINAVNDESILTYSSSTVIVGNILTNDLLNGSTATATNTAVSFPNALPTGITYNAATGVFSATGLAVGKYIISYKLCDAVYTSNCDTATFTIYITTKNGPLVSSRANGPVRVSGVLSNNRIIIAGDFSQYGGATANEIVCLKHEDLSLDTSWLCPGPSTPSFDIIHDFAVLPNDDIIVVGKFADFGGAINGRGIIKIKSNGFTNSNNFNVGGLGVPQGQNIYGIAVLPNGYMYIVGDFFAYNGTPCKYIARLTPGGTLDPTFAPGTSFNGIPRSIAVFDNNSIIVGGDFTTYQGNAAPGIIKITGNSQDPSFLPGTGVGGPAGSTIYDILVRDSEIYVGGSFTSFDVAPFKNLAKLDANGHIIGSFNVGSGFNGAVRTIASQKVPVSYVSSIGSNNIYVGGDFTTYKGATVPYMVCLTNSGTPSANMNTLFNPGAGPNNFVYTITPEKNELKLIIGGAFTSYNSSAADRITRIYPGTLGSGNIQGRESMPTEDIIASSSISIYPNPSEGMFNIDFKGYGEQRFDMTIHNTLGQVIYKGVVTSENTNHIDLTPFDSGSYFITLQSSKETINKIIVKK